MTQEPAHDREAFARIVKESLHKAEERTASLRSTNNRLLIGSVVSSAATTLVAGGTAAAGPLVGDGVAGWRLACIVAAVLAFTATVCTALTQQLRVGDRLSQGHQCVGRLRLLTVDMTTGSRNWEEITKDYTEIAKAYPELFV